MLVEALWRGQVSAASASCRCATTGWGSRLRADSSMHMFDPFVCPVRHSICVACLAAVSHGLLGHLCLMPADRQVKWPDSCQNMSMHADEMPQATMSYSSPQVLSAMEAFDGENYEVFEGVSLIGHDRWSLGCILTALLSGRQPFEHVAMRDAEAARGFAKARHHEWVSSSRLLAPQGSKQVW